MTNLRWRFVVFTSGILFLAAFLLGEVLLRLSSVEDPAEMRWALTHTPTFWTLFLVMGAIIHAVLIFGPLQLPFIAYWMKRPPPSTLVKNLTLLLPTMVISLILAGFTLSHPPDSKAFFNRHLLQPLPTEGTQYRAIHPMGVGAFSQLWGSAHGCRMRIDPKHAEAYCINAGGARYDFEVESLGDAYDGFVANLPWSWGFTLGMPQAQYYQLPARGGTPSFALVDPDRGEMLIMLWHQGW